MTNKINSVLLILIISVSSTRISYCNSSIIDPKLTPAGSKNGTDQTVGRNASNVKATENSKMHSDSWSDWARDKITQELGRRHENSKEAARQMKDVAGDIAMVTKDKISDYAYGAADATTQKAKEAKHVTENKMKEMKNEGTKASFGSATEKVAQAADDIKTKIKGKGYAVEL